jgi:hypothetical protein
VARLDQEFPPALKSSPQAEGLGSIDAVESAADRRDAGTTVRQGDVLFVRGWALNPEHVAAARVFVAIDDGDPVEGVVGLPRPDIVAALGSNGSLGAGFAAAIPIGSIPIGRHVVRAFFAVDDRLFRIPTEAFIAVDPASDPLAGLVPRADGWAIHLDGIFVGSDRLAGGLGSGAALAFGVPATLRGWAVDVDARQPVGGILADDGNGLRPGVVGFDRPDVTEDLGLPGVERCGFAVPLLTPSAGEGAVRLVMLSADRAAYVETEIRVRRAVAQRTTDLPRLDAAVRIAIDDVVAGTTPYPWASPDADVSLRGDELLWIRGWAIDDARGSPPAAVTLCVDDRLDFFAQAGLERPDVAAALGNPALSPCGFVACIPLAGLPPGDHQVAVRVIATDRSGYFEGGRLLRLSIPARRA